MVLHKDSLTVSQLLSPGLVPFSPAAVNLSAMTISIFFPLELFYWNVSPEVKCVGWKIYTVLWFL